MMVHEIIDRPDPRRSPGKVYDATAAEDLADIFLAYAEIMQRNRIVLTREAWRKVIEDALDLVEGLVP